MSTPTTRKARDTRSNGSRGHRRLHCQHQPTGTVAWPLHTPDIGEGHASVYCCRREPCVRDAAQWVQDFAGHLGVYRDFGGDA